MMRVPELRSGQNHPFSEALGMAPMSRGKFGNQLAVGRLQLPRAEELSGVNEECAPRLRRAWTPGLRGPAIRRWEDAKTRLDLAL